jgi:3-oxoacyl-[acyl-carrier protein] reductase
MTRALGEEKISKYLERIPLSRMGTPEDIAAAVAFFAGPGSYVTGQVMEVNGGLYT